MTDQEMLRRYAESRPFEALVKQYFGMVPGATARRRYGDDMLDEEATQNTFAILAGKVSRLTGHPTLVKSSRFQPWEPWVNTCVLGERTPGSDRTR